MTEITLEEAARDLINAMHDGQQHVGYRLDLWNALRDCLDRRPTTPAREAIEAAARLKMVREIADEAPELNMSNYDEDDVSALNSAMINIHGIVNGWQLALPSNHGEPDAWMYSDGERTHIWRHRAEKGEMGHGAGYTETPLYRHPPAASADNSEVLAVLSFAKARAWHHFGIAWDHLEKASQDELVEQAAAFMIAPAASGGEVERLKEALRNDAARFEHCASMIRDPDNAAKAYRYSLEAKAASKTHAGNGGKSEGGEA